MTEVVTVNLKRCENCGVCEMVCAERHGGKARLKVKDVLQSRGLIFDDEALPIVCKQCKNPACIEVCKPKAIVRENDVISIDEDKCIGCGRCAKSCPFNAIFIDESRPAPASDTQERSVFHLLFDRRRRVPRPNVRERAKLHERHTSAIGARGMMTWRASTRAISERSLSKS